MRATSESNLSTIVTPSELFFFPSTMRVLLLLLVSYPRIFLTFNERYLQIYTFRALAMIDRGRCVLLALVLLGIACVLTGSILIGLTDSIVKKSVNKVGRPAAR